MGFKVMFETAEWW